jgi:penicillin-binding protein 2
MVDLRPPENVMSAADRPSGTKPKRMDWRLLILRVLIVSIFAVLLGQLWKLQIVEGHSYRQMADVNRFRVSPVSAPRGVIYDRAGKIVAANTPSFQLSIIPAGLPRQSPESVYEQLGWLLGMDPAEIATKVENRRGDDYTPVAIMSDVDRDVVLRIEERRLRLPGVTIIPESSRLYPYGPLLSHILGYMLPVTEEQLADLQSDREAGYRASDRIGATGVEYSYERELRGKPGRKLYEVDVTERPLADIRIDSPEPGHNLRLTIDVELQQDVEKILAAEMEATGSESAVAIVMDPRNGHILSMVSLPSYDNNVFSGGVRSADLEKLLTDPRRPMLNYAIAGTFPPGSTFKLVTALAALEEEVAVADTKITCNGALLIPNQYNPSLVQRLPCWGVHGTQDFVQGLANSCDVYYWTLGGGFKDFKGLGNERLALYAELLGYGAPTGIDLPGETSGLIPSDDWKEEVWDEVWLTGDTYNMSIGQGFVLATPLQVANMTNAVANGGHLLKPQVVASISDAEDNLLRVLQPEEIRHVPMTAEHRQTIVEAMIEVLHGDVLKKMDVPELKMAGKTGTAEFPGPLNEKGELPTHGWFSAFAPYDNPEVSVTVFFQKGGGPSNAAPVTIDIIKRYFGYQEPAQTVPAGTAVDAPTGSAG